MSVTIHPTAVVDPKAQLGTNVKIGPMCVIGPDAQLNDDVTLISHVSISGHTNVGEGSTLYPFVSLGHPPQDFKHKGGRVSIKLGKHNTLRENVTVHPGTDVGRPETVTGDNCYFMVGSHVAHEARLGNHVTFSNYVQIGGCVTIGNSVIMGGLSAAHQFTRIGDHAFVGAMALVTTDVIPYGSVIGNHAHLAGLNIVGLKRRHFPRETISDLRSAYRLLFAEEGTFKERLADCSRLYADHTQVMEIVRFIETQDKRSICMPHTGR
nr:acyl-ACP--UDP-N-acetylglucosamine O-acyltransferase [Robiginitomaculum antarcticum]